MIALVRQIALTITVVLILMLGGSAIGQGIYLHHVDGLGPLGELTDGATLTFHMRVVGSATNHKMLNNGFTFASDGLSWGEVVGEYNPDYPWEDWFDFIKVINLWTTGSGEDTVGIGLLSMFGDGLPAGFDDIAFSFTIGPITGSDGASLTLDSSWYPPSNPWMWDVVDRDVAWGGPYSFIGDGFCTSPFITSQPETQAVVDFAYSYDVEANGVPNPTFELVTYPSGMTIDPASGFIQWTPTEEQVGERTVTVAANNDCGEPTTQTFTVEVLLEYPCEPAVITSSPPVDATEGAIYTYDVEATGDPTPTYILPVCPDGMTIDPATGVIEWTPSIEQAGDHAVAVVAANDCGIPAFQPFTISVLDVPCEPAVITSSPSGIAVAGYSYTYDVGATGFPDPAFLLPVCPDGMTIDPTTGVIEWTPSADHVGVQTVTVVALNDCGTPAYQPFVINVLVDPPCDLPVFTTTAPAEAIIGQSYKYYANAGEVGDITYTLECEYPAIWIGDRIGDVTWIPTQAGDHTLAIGATASCIVPLPKVTQEFVVHVSCAPPIINSEPVTDAWVGYLYEYDVRYVNDRFFRDVTFDLLEAPDGMTIDAATGFIEWMPTGDGEFPVTVEASLLCEGDVYTDTQSLTVKVPGLPVTYCLPHMIYMRVMEDLHFVHIIHEDPADIVWESVKIFGKVPPYNGYPIVQDGHLVTACDPLRFLAAGNFRPITSDFEAPYTVEYDKTDGDHVVLTGEFACCPGFCEKYDAEDTIDPDVVALLADYFWRGGDTREFYLDEINAIMDIDGNGRVDVLDVIKMHELAGYK